MRWNRDRKVVDVTQLSFLPPTDEAYDVVYADDQFVVVSKPAKLLTVPGRNPENGDCLISRVQKEFPEAMIVHRLDYDTSGLVVLPLNKPALSHISKQFQARTLSKSYIALVDGLVEPDDGKIDLPIAKSEHDARHFKICHEYGKPSLTYFEVLQRDEARNRSRVLLKPVTGRSHQLRLHMQAIGHVMLGDLFYAPPELQTVVPRLMLHARDVAFVHPLTGEEMQFQSETPF